MCLFFSTGSSFVFLLCLTSMQNFCRITINMNVSLGRVAAYFVHTAHCCALQVSSSALSRFSMPFSLFRIPINEIQTYLHLLYLGKAILLLGRALEARQTRQNAVCALKRLGASYGRFFSTQWIFA